MADRWGADKALLLQMQLLVLPGAISHYYGDELPLTGVKGALPAVRVRPVVMSQQLLMPRFELWSTLRRDDYHEAISQDLGSSILARDWA